MVLVGIAILSLAFLGVALVAICLHDLGLINPELELMGIVLVPILLIYTLVILSSPQLQNGSVWSICILFSGYFDAIRLAAIKVIDFYCECTLGITQHPWTFSWLQRNRFGGFAKGGLSWEVVCLRLWYSLCVRLWSGCRPQGGGTRSDWEVLCLDLPGCTQGLSSLRQQPCHWFGVSFWAGSAVPILLIAGVQTLMCLVCKVQETCCMYGSYYGRFWYSWRFWQPSSSSKCGTGNPRTVGRASKTHITLWVPANQTFRFPSPKYKSPEWLQCFLGPTSWRWNAQVMGRGIIYVPCDDLDINAGFVQLEFLYCLHCTLILSRWLAILSQLVGGLDLCGEAGYWCWTSDTVALSAVSTTPTWRWNLQVMGRSGFLICTSGI